MHRLYEVYLWRSSWLRSPSLLQIRQVCCQSALVQIWLQSLQFVQSPFKACRPFCAGALAIFHMEVERSKSPAH